MSERRDRLAWLAQKLRTSLIDVRVLREISLCEEWQLTAYKDLNLYLLGAISLLSREEP